MDISSLKTQAALDEVFVFRLKALHSILAPLMHESLKNRLAKDKAFKRDFEEWVKKQGWPLNEKRKRNVADQAAYILINKILFYKALERKKNLPPLTRKENVSDLLKNLRKCFKEALKIDYRAVFQRDPIYDEIPLTPKLAKRLNILIDEVSEYDLSKMKRDVIGTLYEKLIPKEERRTLGQFYTPPQIVELIVKMCVKNPDDKILDPGCGSGGFLVASYDRLLNLKGKTETDQDTHEEILSQIWGVDINKFPAHLATINLANQNLESQSDHINVIISDFFNLTEPKQKLLAPWSTVDLDNQREEVEIPMFDCIVANPPYTRQEQIPKKQKKKIRQESLRYKRKKVKLSARAGIYTYFFLHGAKFLKDGGRMGMIVSNSWLDVRYGRGLKKFFLDHFKILAVIDADKRVFKDADVNTVVVILEKAEGEEHKDERNENLVKFVRLKTHMEIDEIIKKIEKHDEYFTDEKIKIYPKMQKDLWEEGFDKKKHRYVGSKWGKYIRAPDIYFKILEKGKDLFVPLKEVAEVRRGFTTGANEFFYLPSKHFDIQEEGEELVLLDKKTDEERFRIEREFVKPVVKSAKDSDTILIEPGDVRTFLFWCKKSKKSLAGTSALAYIRWGEQMGFHKRSTLSSRKIWYFVGDKKPADALIPRRIGERMPVFEANGLLEDCVLFGITRKDKTLDLHVFLGILNSIWVRLFIELNTRQLTGAQAVADTNVYVVKEVLVPNPELMSDGMRSKIKQAYLVARSKTSDSIFLEMGFQTKGKDISDIDPEDTSIDNTVSYRRDLDKVVFEALGLTKKEQLKTYKAVVDLVRRRLVKAKDIEVLVGQKIEREKSWPLSSKELEELVTLLQLSKVGRLNEEQESTLGRRGGMVVRDLAYEFIRLRHEPVSTGEVASEIVDVKDEVLHLAGYYQVISEVMGGEATPKQVIRGLLGIWRDRPEGVERTISRLLSGDDRFLEIESNLFGLKGWSPNELFQIYVQLVSEYRTSDYDKKETFKSEAIKLLESGQVDFPDRDGLLKTLRRL